MWVNSTGLDEPYSAVNYSLMGLSASDGEDRVILAGVV